MLPRRRIGPPADLLQRAGAGRSDTSRGRSSAAGRAGLLLHDQGVLDPRLDAVQLVLLDAGSQPHQLAEGHVQGFLGPVGARTRVAEHRAAVAERVVAGGDAVAQAALFADLGEEPRSSRRSGPQPLPRPGNSRGAGTARWHRRCRSGSARSRRGRGRSPAGRPVQRPARPGPAASRPAGVRRGPPGAPRRCGRPGRGSHPWAASGGERSGPVDRDASTASRSPKQERPQGSG